MVALVRTLDFVSIFLIFVLVLFGLLHLVAFFYREHIRASIPVDVNDYPACYTGGQEWREKTDIRFIEELKNDLYDHENKILRAHRDPIAFQVWQKQLTTSQETFWFNTLTFLVGPKTVSDSYVHEYWSILNKLDRLWSGKSRLEIEDLTVEIDKLKRSREDCEKSTKEGKRELRQIDEKIIDKEREIRDLKELARRAEEKSKQAPTHEDQFEEKKRRRTLDLKDEIFEAFEGPVQKEVELRLKYNELREKIAKNREIDPAQRDQLLEQLEQHFRSQTSKREQSSKLKIYKANG